MNQEDRRFVQSSVSDELELVYTKPNFDHELIQNSMTDFEIVSSGNFDFYSANMIYENAEDGYAISWMVYGVKQDAINFSLPKIAEKILADHPNFNLNNLVVSSSTSNKINGIESYEDFIYTILDLRSDQRKLIMSTESVERFN